MLSNIATLAFLSLWAQLSRADITTLTPGPGQAFAAGSNCTLIWTADNSGLWKNVTVDLMSGSNTNMSLVTSIISGLDATDPHLTALNWTCPEVDPYSAIYFYQFTNDGEASDARWSTRFTITSADGQSVPPANATQPTGEAIPWGIGQLAQALGNGSYVDSTSAALTDTSNTEQIDGQDADPGQWQDQDSQPRAGLRMSNSSAERERISPWIQYYPLLIILYILY